jgi:2-furoyl-CoA dehydrogenase FAD binding subunit
VRAGSAEAALLSGAGSSQAAAAAVEEIDPGDDLHATGEYRTKVARVLVERALERAMEEARSA